MPAVTVENTLVLPRLSTPAADTGGERTPHLEAGALAGLLRPDHLGDWPGG